MRHIYATVTDEQGSSGEPILTVLTGMTLEQFLQLGDTEKVVLHRKGGTTVTYEMREQIHG